MNLIYVCSPLRGLPPYKPVNRNKNLRKAIVYSSYVIEQGYIPITPHLFFRDMLNDKDREQRRIGMQMGRELLTICAEVWVFGDIISKGMKTEIELAESIGIPVVYV